jgi:phosphate acetyltransferase
MIARIFIASTEKSSGKSLVTIGLLSALQGIVPQVGYMKPVGQRYKPGESYDSDASLIKNIFGLKDDIKHINPMPISEAQQNKDALFERIFECIKIIEKGKDAICIEGTDYTSTTSALEFDINVELAKNLSAPVLLVTHGHNKSIDEIILGVVEYAESFIRQGCTLLGVVVNRFSSENFRKDALVLKQRLEKKGVPLFGVIFNNSRLSGPRLSQVIDNLEAEVLIKGDSLDTYVTDKKIFAMTPENALEHINGEDGCLVITPGDRVEHIFTVLSAHKSAYFPEYAGIVLTGGLKPRNNALTLLEGIADAGLTVLSVKHDTLDTALRLNDIKVELSETDLEKIDIIKQSVQRYVDTRKLWDKLDTIKTDIVTPRMFQYRIIEKAKEVRKKIVLPEGTELRILKAAEEIIHRSVCDLVLLGDNDAIEAAAKREGIDISGVDIVDHQKDGAGKLEGYAQTLYELRKHRGVSLERSRDVLLDPVVYAAMMVRQGDADGYVSGATHSTADTLRPVLQLIRTKPGVLLASSILMMLMPEKVLVYGDCALVAKPTAEELADIAVTSAETAGMFGIEPIVAMLSYSTGESGTGEDVDKVRKATELAKEKRPDLLIEGPIQYDAAISAKVAMVKSKDSKVAGRATIYIFPDLDAGNTAYKAVQRAANVTAIGPVLQGLNKPANDLSRGATVTDIVYTIAVTAIQAQEEDK